MLQTVQTLSFNPLDRVKFVQIWHEIAGWRDVSPCWVSIPQIGSNLFKFEKEYIVSCLADVSIPQIGSNLFKFTINKNKHKRIHNVSIPQIGSNLFKWQCKERKLSLQYCVSIPQIGSNLFKLNLTQHALTVEQIKFQSPRSGQICSNLFNGMDYRIYILTFQSPRSGQICSNSRYGPR